MNMHHRPRAAAIVDRRVRGMVRRAIGRRVMPHLLPASGHSQTAATTQAGDRAAPARSTAPCNSSAVNSAVSASASSSGVIVSSGIFATPSGTASSTVVDDRQPRRRRARARRSGSSSSSMLVPERMAARDGRHDAPSRRPAAAIASPIRACRRSTGSRPATAPRRRLQKKLTTLIRMPTASRRRRPSRPCSSASQPMTAG